MRYLARDEDALAGGDDQLLTADLEAQPTREDVRDLLVHVVVARHDGPRGQDDPADRNRLRVRELPPEERRQLLDGFLVPVPHEHGTKLILGRCSSSTPTRGRSTRSSRRKHVRGSRPSPRSPGTTALPPALSSSSRSCPA